MADGTSSTGAESVVDVPHETLRWLTDPENPAVAVMTRRELLGEAETPESTRLWERRNEYGPVAAILAEVPSLLAAGTRDYAKYRGPLWQVHFLGELWADGADERVRPLADHAFSQQLDDGAWSTTGRRDGAIPCLTSNVGRALARMGWARDARVLRALEQVVGVVRDCGRLVCPGGGDARTLNGYCHMLAPKLLLFLAEVPRELWPDGAVSMRDECVRALRAREVYRCLPDGSRAFLDVTSRMKTGEVPAARERWISEHGPLKYADKPGWLRFGYPLSYNSDVLESLAALAAVGEYRRPEYELALDVVRAAADPRMRWTMRNSLNGKMIADVEKKGQASKWLTLRALEVLRRYGASCDPETA